MNTFPKRIYTAMAMVSPEKSMPTKPAQHSPQGRGEVRYMSLRVK
jgi:hypothetical protein